MLNDLFSVAGRIALVTGASRGIGARIAAVLDAAQSAFGGGPECAVGIELKRAPRRPRHRRLGKADDLGEETVGDFELARRPQSRLGDDGGFVVFSLSARL